MNQDFILNAIRKNLIEASTNLYQIYPAAPGQISQEINAAWERYRQLVKQTEMKTALPGKALLRKSDRNMGFIWVIPAALVGIATILGGGAWLTKELTESERLNKLSECIKDKTQNGIRPEEAEKQCKKVYDPGPPSLISLGEGNLTNALVLGGLAIGGVLLLGRVLK